MSGPFILCTLALLASSISAKTIQSPRHSSNVNCYDNRDVCTLLCIKEGGIGGYCKRASFVEYGSCICCSGSPNERFCLPSICDHDCNAKGNPGGQLQYDADWNVTGCKCNEWPAPGAPCASYACKRECEMKDLPGGNCIPWQSPDAKCQCNEWPKGV